MAVDMFIKLTNIKGESKDSKHKDEIDVLAWSWGASQSANAHSGGGAGAGKANIQDLSFTKYVDRSTPTLLSYLVSGKHVDVVNLVVRKAGGTPLEYIKIELKTVFISSVSTGGSGGEDRLTENVTLNFAKVKFEYIPQNDKGAAEASIPMSYDIAQNVVA